MRPALLHVVRDDGMPRGKEDLMPKANGTVRVAALRREGTLMLRRMRKDAEALVARGRAEVLKDVRAVKTGAHRAVRELERQVVRQFHAATTEQVRRLERRVAKLERALAELKGVSTEGAA
jgi:hypothetical protein